MGPRVCLAAIAWLLVVACARPEPSSPTAPTHGGPVPQLIGSTRTAAMARLERMSFRPVDAAAASDGVVIAQSPPAGWPLDAGGEVMFAVADGPLTAEQASAAISLAQSSVGPGFTVLGLEEFHDLDGKEPRCGGDGACLLVRLTDGQSGATALAHLPTSTLLDVARESAPPSPRRLRSDDQLIAAALADPFVQGRIGRAAFDTAVAGGGDGPWCAGPHTYPGNYCDTVMVFLRGRDVGPILVSVNWITGASGIYGTGR